MNRRNAIKNSALLTGISIAGFSFSTLLQSCQKQNRITWEPLFFTKSQALNIAAITDTILPASDTPGALDLKVDIFVDLMMKETLSSEDQEHVMKGYEQFVKTTNEMFQKDFHLLNAEEKSQVLQKVGENTNYFNPSIWGSTLGKQAPLNFYRRLKQFALIGYFTSEEIGNNVLVYDPIPQEYKACIPLDEVGNAWTL